MTSNQLKRWGAWRNLLSLLFDRQDERLPMTLVPSFKAPEGLWEYLRKYVPYTGDPAVPWAEGRTKGFFDYTVHPLRLLLHAENNRLYIESGYQFFWPQHVAADCDDVALLAAWLAEYSGLGRAQVLLLAGTPAKATHAICVIERGSGMLTSIDTSGVHHHHSAQALKGFMEAQFDATYEVRAMPQPFGLNFTLELDV